jgi:hypothetical protein
MMRPLGNLSIAEKRFTDGWILTVLFYEKGDRGEIPAIIKVCRIGVSIKRPLRRRADMRKIETRGKRIDTREWVYGFYVGADEKHYIFTGKTGLSQVTPAHCLMYEDFERYEVIPESVGRYTGLDAAESNRYITVNGKKEKDLRIFEGDIVKGYYFLKNEYYVGKVEYSEELSAYILTEHGHNQLVWLSCFGKPDIEIIGNVHDTPELLIRK